LIINFQLDAVKAARSIRALLSLDQINEVTFAKWRSGLITCHSTVPTSTSILTTQTTQNIAKSKVIKSVQGSVYILTSDLTS